MCGRYTLATPNPAELRSRFPIGEAVQIRTRYNIAPGDEVLAVTTNREGNPRGELLRWGLVPSWSKRPQSELKMINARVESAAHSPAFRGAFERFRCLIVADGFYEWAGAPAGHKRAFRITRVDGGVFAFAGLWSIWRGNGDHELRTCAILTTTANSRIARLHDRMPIILADDVESAWLEPSTPQQELWPMLVGLPASETALTRVGPAVNDARYDGPACLASPPDEPPLPQTTLF